QVVDFWREQVEQPLVRKDVETRQGSGAGNGIAGEGVTMEECLQLTVLPEKGVIDPLRGECRGKRQISRRDPLGEGHYVGSYPFPLAGEHVACAAEADRHLVGDHEYIVVVTQFAHPVDKPVR